MPDPSKPEEGPLDTATVDDDVIPAKDASVEIYLLRARGWVGAAMRHMPPPWRTARRPVIDALIDKPATLIGFHPRPRRRQDRLAKG